MKTTRVHPFVQVFGESITRFEAIRGALGPSPELDAFLMSRDAIELMHELRPDEGYDGAVDELVALTHAAYCYWAAGSHTISLDAENTRALTSHREAARSAAERPCPPPPRYIQLAPRLIWAQLDPDSAFEPLDGWFALPVSSALRVVACFGVHPNRPGFSVIAVEGPAPAIMHRADGTPLFAPVMPGADAAGLHAIVEPDELLWLAWHANQRAEVDGWP